MISNLPEPGPMGPTRRSRTRIDDEVAVSADGPRWYACRTRARSEKKVDRLLTAAGITSYVPLIERVRAWSDRSKRVAFPLFPGYVFARSTLDFLPEIVRTPNLIEIVRVNGAPTPIRETEIESIRSLVHGSQAIGEEPAAHEYLVRGQQVRVIQGPFKDMVGILTEVRGKTKIVVRLTAIRQAVSVEMASGFVSPVNGQAAD
jgi:transcription antitermination factor NusG